MALKPNGLPWGVREQIYEDLVSRLTLKFETNPEREDAPYKLTLIGDCLPYGNREILFGLDGDVVGGGTAVGGVCRPSWLREIKPEDE